MRKMILALVAILWVVSASMTTVNAANTNSAKASCCDGSACCSGLPCCK